MEVSRSGFYKWTHDRDGARKRHHAEILRHIRKVFEQSRQTYGVRRVFKQLRRSGMAVSRKLVQKLMHQEDIRPRRKRAFKRTTDSNHKLPVSRNHLRRQFVVDKPNMVWVSDITYIETREGWLYLSAFIDLYSRKVVGWSMSDRMTADLVVSAFDMAIKHRGQVLPALVHSDRGSQYASESFRRRLKKCKQSMSRKGNCWDNAVAESFFGALKSELVYQKTFTTRKEAEMHVFDYVEIFYNRTRLHSTLGYLSPIEFEQKGRKAA